MEIIKFDEWSKIEFKIGEVKNISKNSVKIIVNEKVFEAKLDLNIKKGDKIAVIVNNNNLIIPLVNNSVIVPETDIETGSRVR